MHFFYLEINEKNGVHITAVYKLILIFGWKFPQFNNFSLLALGIALAFRELRLEPTVNHRGPRYL